MTQVFEFMRNMVASAIQTFDTFKINIGGINVGLIQLMIGMIAISIVVSALWKGVKG